MTSAAIRDVRYDPEALVLEVQFTSGATYEYYGVPQRTYEAFLAAPSQGRYFAYEFRDQFPYRRKSFPRR